jgi:hypothetical protein
MTDPALLNVESSLKHARTVLARAGLISQPLAEHGSVEDLVAEVSARLQSYQPAEGLSAGTVSALLDTFRPIQYDGPNWKLPKEIRELAASPP